jgi:hypothetical protein
MCTGMFLRHFNISVVGSCTSFFTGFLLKSVANTMQRQVQVVIALVLLCTASKPVGSDNDESFAYVFRTRRTVNVQRRDQLSRSYPRCKMLSSHIDCLIGCKSFFCRSCKCQGYPHQCARSQDGWSSWPYAAAPPHFAGR